MTSATAARDRGAGLAPALAAARAQLWLVGTLLVLAAIITTQTERNHPKAPSAVHGPLSIPCIWSAVHHQPATASANNASTSQRRERTAENAGARPSPRGTRSAAVELMRSDRPGEL